MSFTEDDEKQLKEIRTFLQQYRQKRVANLLRGPYICPKCNKDHFFGVKTTKKTEKDITNIYNFECRYKPCGFKANEKINGNDSIIDAYNRLMDRER